MKNKFKTLKIKDIFFKCQRFDRHDFDGYTGCLDVEHKSGMYIKGLKYCSRVSPDSEYSKKSAKKQLIKFIIEHEDVILEQLS